ASKNAHRVHLGYLELAKILENELKASGDDDYRKTCASYYKMAKEGFVNLARAIINPGDVAIVPAPAYPIHTQAFIIAGGNVAK
ncbi:hypothetical protein VWN77_10575, partial [Campylobacter coli]